ncbi:MAG: hypothetical protein LBC12_00925 [Nitrososphaerota archaeon]|nr:hypothetical protein [Nitrososphaerota archaeon]
MQSPLSASNTETPEIWVEFLNGTNCTPETALFTFSMKESLEGNYVAQVTLTFDDYYNEISLPATISNGRVFIDSTPTTFIVDPSSLIENNTIQICQTENLSLSGTVIHEVQQPTLIENYQVVSKTVLCSYQQTDDSGLFIGHPVLWFDPETGVLVRAASQFSDVLLNKLGVAFIFGGVFDLVDYSENLNFTLVRITTPHWKLALIPIFVVLFASVVFSAYKSSKKKKQDKRKTYSNKSKNKLLPHTKR